MSVSFDRLTALYAVTDDPWDFRASSYEHAKFADTVAALPRRRYVHALELGCGNGELARRIAPLCGDYTGVDAVERALAAARIAVPKGRFVRGYLPCQVPEGSYDLIVLSEILYFLGSEDIETLCAQVDANWPDADVLAVSWRGPSGNPLQGEEALAQFAKATARRQEPIPSVDPSYRIDVFAPLSPGRRS